MIDGIGIISAVYFLFGFLIMNSIIVQCYLDNTIKITRKKVVLAIFILLTPFVVFETIGIHGWEGFFLSSFVYFIYPLINIYEKHKKLSVYKEQLSTFLGCELVAFVGCFGVAFSILYGIEEFSDILLISVFVIGGSIFNVVSIRHYVKYIKFDIAMLYGKNETMMVLIYIIVTIFSISNNAVIVNEDINAYSAIFQKSVSVILLIMIPLLMKKDRESIYYVEQSIRNAHFLDMQLMAYNTYREAQEDTRAFRHDINNNLAIIATLMQEKKYDEAEKYVKELNGNIAALSPKIITGDDMLDTLLLSKFSYIKNNNIEFSVKGVIAGGLGWKALDVCTVFSNLIDNAVEACQKIEDTKKRFIEINFRQAELQYIITIKNSVEGTKDIKRLNSNSKYTTKEDAVNHGYGMMNVRNVIEKNNAMLQIKCDGEVFETDIIVVKQQVKA